MLVSMLITPQKARKPPATQPPIALVNAEFGATVFGQETTFGGVAVNLPAIPELLVIFGADMFGQVKFGG